MLVRATRLDEDTIEFFCKSNSLKGPNGWKDGVGVGMCGTGEELLEEISR
jgi:hypothetical protein